MSALRGHWWFVRRYGLGQWWRYERDRRGGTLIDYERVFTADERAVLGEHARVPWEQR